MTMKKKEPATRGSYIPEKLLEHGLNGDAFVPMTDAYQVCSGKRRVSYEVFQADLREQLRLGKVEREGNRLYLRRTLRYEESAAEHLAALLKNNDLPVPALAEEWKVGELTLNGEQREAVCLALSHRLSVIQGGAGSGKTTLIQAIASQFGAESRRVLAAPTGKAAHNLTERTGLAARTVHSALGMHPDDDFLSPVQWENVGLVIVDEASMMSLEMLAGLLCKMELTCRLVLLGDPNQLQSVGSGNVLPDLLALGVPHICLECNHRQAGAGHGLQNNVVDFSRHHSLADLTFDESFEVREMSEVQVRDKLVQEAACRYRRGENVQVLSPYNRVTELSVDQLNRVLRDLVNPAGQKKPELYIRGQCFRQGDRVLITKNDCDKNCVNGDVGIFWVDDADEKTPAYHVALSDGRCPHWEGYMGLESLTLAYALTVHKAQGSEYDTVIMPMTNSVSGMLHRNLAYTAFSRARKKVILFGSTDALGAALRKPAQPRRSMLVAKTHMAMERRAG